MWSVAAATLPALIVAAVLYGAAVWYQLAVLLVSCWGSELICLYWRRQPLRTLLDGSATVVACILALALPPAAPGYVAAAAAVGAIMLAKHCYGGLGNTPFNPAMVGYALAFLSFPQHFSLWADLAELPATVQAVSGPTPLSAARLDIPLTGDPRYPLLPLAAAAGGIFLLIRRFADWRLTLSFMLGAAAVYAVAAVDWRNVLYGGMIFTAFFVITDPVSAAATRGGRWLYGFLTGALAVWLRLYGAHTDGIAFAILIGNILAPLCDLIAEKWRTAGSP